MTISMLRLQFFVHIINFCVIPKIRCSKERKPWGQSLTRTEAARYIAVRGNHSILLQQFSMQTLLRHFTLAHLKDEIYHQISI